MTGGLGFIGTNLIPKLIQEFNAEIIVLDNFSNNSEQLDTSNLQIIRGDIRDKSLVEDAVGEVNGVIHLAAHTRVMDSIETPIVNFETNVVGTLNLLEAMRKFNVTTLINASTGGAILGDATPPINEDMVAKPTSPYGASKLAIEGYLHAYGASFGLNAISLRFSNIYGPYCRKKKSVVAAFLEHITERNSVTVYGDGTQTRDFLFVDDLVEGIMLAIKYGSNNVFQLGSGRGTSINDLISSLKETTGINFKVEYKPFRNGEIKHTFCDISKAKKLINYNPATDLKTGLNKLWEWYKK